MAETGPADNAPLEALAPYLRQLVHDLKNPLAVIYGEAFRLRQNAAVGPVPPESLEQTAETLERMSLRLLELIQGLRSAVDTGPGEPLQVVPLQGLIEAAVRTVGRTLEALSIELDTVSEVQAGALVCVRPPEMIRVLWNLLNLSAESLARTEGPRRIRLTTETVGGEQRISIVDNSLGLLPGCEARLTAVRFWLRQCGGQLSYDDRPGQTSLTTHLPRVE